MLSGSSPIADLRSPKSSFFQPIGTSAKSPKIFQWKFEVQSHILCRNEDYKNHHQYSLRGFATIVQNCQVCIDGRPFLDALTQYHQSKSPDYISAHAPVSPIVPPHFASWQAGTVAWVCFEPMSFGF